MHWTPWKDELALKLFTCLAVAMALVGCGGGSSSTSSGGSGGSGGGAAPTAAKHIYVIQNSLNFGNTPGNILEFSTAASGNVSPESTIVPPQAGDDLQGLATDSEGNVYVATRTQTAAATALLEYAPGASGSATPIGNIPSNATTDLYVPDGIAIGPAGQIVVGEDSGAIATYSATANGSAPPQYFIEGPFQIMNPLSPVNAAQDVAVGVAGEIYVFNWNQSFNTLAPIDIFAADATGNVAPIATLGGSMTGLNAGQIGGIATDSSGNLYVSTSGSGGGSILVFASTASGNVGPIRTISGSATQLNGLGGIQLDALGNIYVVSATGDGQNPTVLEFSADASGNAAPVLSITSTVWTYPDDYFSLAVY